MQKFAPGTTVQAPFRVTLRLGRRIFDPQTSHAFRGSSKGVRSLRERIAVRYEGDVKR